MVALEVGCGTSMVTSMLEDLGYAVLACDFSKAAIADAREDAGGEQRLIADCCRLPLRSESVDVVVDKATIDTLLCAPAGRDGMAAAYAEAARVLRPGGKLLSVSHSSRRTVIEG